MKRRLIICIVLLAVYVSSKGQVRGQVADSLSREPLVGASVNLNRQGQHIRTGEKGQFLMGSILQADTLVVSYLGYRQKRIPVNAATKGSLFVLLSPDSNALEEVEVNTGFYQVPKERATGSFTHIDKYLSFWHQQQLQVHCSPLAHSIGLHKLRQMGQHSFPLDHLAMHYLLPDYLNHRDPHPRQ
ncbi:CarboxypepD_reg-like domain-containing protein [bacterium A37T11]|nr:CarboxypepD_reg-like domain-containing protein [bacterium A37T11]